MGSSSKMSIDKNLYFVNCGDVSVNFSWDQGLEATDSLSHSPFCLLVIEIMDIFVKEP